MNHSKLILKKLIFIILTSFTIGCTTTININDYINQNRPLELNLNHGLNSADRLQIASHSAKFKKLIQWGKQNCEGWESTPASYDANIFVGQGDFRLLYSLNSDGVVIGFTDKKGNPKQYSKSVQKGELDFLVKP